MTAQATIHDATDALSARRVYADPYEKNGLTVYPAARIMGGGGGGEGQMPQGEGGQTTGTGWGGGFGLRASPAGALVIRGDSVRWIPAIDATRIVLGFQLVAVVAVWALRSVLKARAQARAAALRA